MYPPLPILYNGCSRCDGLFYNLEAFYTHIHACDGDKVKSTCDFFACPKQTYLKLFPPQVTGLENPLCIPASNEIHVQHKQIKIQPGSLVSVLRKNSTSLAKPMKIIGIVKTRSKSLDNGTLLNAQELSSQLSVMSKLPLRVIVPSQSLGKNPQQNAVPFEASDAEELDAAGTPGSDLHRDGILSQETVLGQDAVFRQDTVLGHHGQNPVLGQHGQDTVLSQHGQNPVLGQHGPNPVLGHHGQDTVLGQHGPNPVLGHHGQDTVLGQHGQNPVLGHHGQNTVLSQHGQNPVLGQHGPNPVLGHHGQDTILGQHGQNPVLGHHGQNTVLSQHGQNTVLGQHGQDAVFGQDAVLNQDTVLVQEAKSTDSQWVASDKNGHLVYRCKLCPHESNHVTFIRRHVLAHHGGKLVQCDQCSFTSTSRSQLNAHQKQHNPPSFLCEHCPLTFKNKSSLTRHIAKKHNGKTNFACKDCEFVAVNSTSLRDHTRKHTGELLYCDQCSYVTKLERALSQHKARHQGVPRFVCDTCGYKTVESGSFKRHVLIHTGKKLFKCPDCSYKATSRYVVVKHVYGKHIDFKRYACNKCDFKTAYYSGLSMHLMSHEGIKPYKCSLCSYRSTLSSKIKRHCAQKHVKDLAEVIKVENCLKFDVQDYMNRDIPRVDVKVIRLSDKGAKEEEEEVEEEHQSAEATGEAPGLAPDIADDGLLCVPGMPVMPSEADDMEDMNMIEGGFGLCNDPTFPMINHNYPSEDSNLFIPRGRLDSASSASNQRIRFSTADTLETDNIMSDLSNTPFKSNPFGSIGLGLRSESWDNLTLIKPHSLGNMGLGSRSESWDNLTQIKPTLFKSFDPRDFLSSLKATDLDTVGDQAKDSGEEHSSIGNTNQLFQVDQYPVSTMDKSFPSSHHGPHPEKDKPLCSLLSPEESRPVQLQSLNSKS